MVFLSQRSSWLFFILTGAVTMEMAKNMRVAFSVTRQTSLSQWVGVEEDAQAFHFIPATNPHSPSLSPNITIELKNTSYNERNGTVLTFVTNEETNTTSHNQYHRGALKNGTISDRLTCKIHKHEIQFPIFPHLIIIGAQKSGTTALNLALQKIPNFVESVWREPHFWDFEALPVLKKRKVTHREQCNLAKQYLGCWDLQNATKSSILYEKTPSLLAIPSLARHMRSFKDKMHPNHPVKLVVLLRDPVERFYSHFKMDYARGVNQKRVGSVIREEMEELVQHGVIHAPVYHRQLPLNEIDGSSPNQTIPFRVGSRVPKDYKGFVARGFYSRQLRPYLKYFPLGESLMVVQYEEFKEKPVEVLARILKFVTGKDTPVSEEAKLAMQEDLGPRISKRKYYHPLTNHSEDYLRLLYEPFNKELVNILGESWRDVWTQ